MTLRLPNRPEQVIRDLLVDNWNPSNTAGFDPTQAAPSADDFLPISTSVTNIGQHYPNLVVTFSNETSAGDTSYNYLTTDGPGQVRDGSVIVTARTEETGRPAYTGDSDAFAELDAEAINQVLLDEVERIVIENANNPADTGMSYLGTVATADAPDDLDATPPVRIADRNISYGWLRDPRGPELLEGFESGNLSAYGGTTSAFNVQSGTVKSGTFALAGGGSGGPTISDTGVTTKRGQRFYCQIRLTNAERGGGFLYCTQNETDSSDGYFARVHADIDVLVLYRYSGGSLTSIAADDFDPSTGLWYELRVDLTADGDHTLSVHDQTGTELAATPTVTDTTYSSGGIGFRADATTVYIDDYESEAL